MWDRKRKYDDRAIIEPVRVIEERKKIGQHPSCPVPAGAILCYDAAFWQWVCAGLANIEGDGWLKGAYLVAYKDSHILVLKVPGSGAPTAVMTLEELIAFGIHKFVNLGAAGGLRQNMNIGDIVICDRAIRDEGASDQYLPAEKYAFPSPELTENLSRAFESKDIPYSKGTTWTTDAPYRETIEELRQYRSDGVATVEMEASALFAVGAYRGASVSAIFTISDLLSEEDWDQGYHSEEKLEGLKKIFDVALAILGKRDTSDTYNDDGRKESQQT
jgi:uridine phosphorylase